MFTRSTPAGARRTGGKILAIVMILAFLGASLPQAALAATDADCQETYTVKSGDWLTKIAANYDDILWSDIATANDLEAPYVIFVGQKLCIPEKGSTGSSGSSGGSGSGTGTSGRITVEEDDDQLTVSVTGMDDKAYFFVKVDDAGKGAEEWFKVGVLNTDNDGEGEETFDLPDDLSRTTDFNVCLKNTTTDDLICNDASLTRLSDKDKDDDESSSSSKKGTFTVSRSGNRIVITTSNFPEDSFYNVKAGEYGQGTPDWFKLGILRTENDGSDTYSYDLPKELQDVDDLQICTKNLTNNDLKCVVNNN